MNLPHTTQLHRLNSLRKLHPQVDGFIVSNPQNIQYLTGLVNLYPIERESLLFITRNEAILYHTPFITPPRSPHVRSQVLLDPKNYVTFLGNVFKSNSEVVIEADDYKVTELTRLKNSLPEVTFKEVTDLLMPLRKIKDNYEIRQLRKAGRIGKKAFQSGILFLKEYPNASEKAVATHIDYSLMKLGADEPAFPTIVAFDSHSSLPHHKPGKQKLRDGVVLIDMGAKVSGYCSDLTRTIHCGKPTPKFRAIERIVRKSYLAAMKTLEEPGATAQQVDTAAREVIEAAGFGPHFIHTTGHGIGLQAHEPPSISTYNQDELIPGMVITIEPGIYLPGHFGYRHENTFLKTSTGCTALT